MKRKLLVVLTTLVLVGLNPISALAETGEGDFGIITVVGDCQEGESGWFIEFEALETNAVDIGFRVTSDDTLYVVPGLEGMYAPGEKRNAFVAASTYFSENWLSFAGIDGDAGFHSEASAPVGVCDEPPDPLVFAVNDPTPQCVPWTPSFELVVPAYEERDLSAAVDVGNDDSVDIERNLVSGQNETFGLVEIDGVTVTEAPFLVEVIDDSSEEVLFSYETSYTPKTEGCDDPDPEPEPAHGSGPIHVCGVPYAGYPAELIVEITDQRMDPEDDKVKALDNNGGKLEWLHRIGDTDKFKGTLNSGVPATIGGIRLIGDQPVNDIDVKLVSWPSCDPPHEPAVCPFDGPNVFIMADRILDVSVSGRPHTSTVAADLDGIWAEVIGASFDARHPTDPTQEDEQWLANFVGDLGYTTPFTIDLADHDRVTPENKYYDLTPNGPVFLRGVTSIGFEHISLHQATDGSPNSIEGCIKVIPVERTKMSASSGDFCDFDEQTLVTRVGVNVKVKGHPGSSGTVTLDDGQSGSYHMPASGETVVSFDTAEGTRTYTVVEDVTGHTASGTEVVVDDCTPPLPVGEWSGVEKCEFDEVSKASKWPLDLTFTEGYEWKFTLADGTELVLNENGRTMLPSPEPTEVFAQFNDPESVWGWQDAGSKVFDPKDDCPPDPTPFEFDFVEACVTDETTGLSTYPFGAMWTIGVDVRFYLVEEGEIDLPIETGYLLPDGDSHAIRVEHFDHVYGWLDDGIFQYPAVASCDRLGEIGDLVWYDTNENGVRDGDEKGISGVTVNLLDSDGVMVKTTTTDADGGYMFTDLPAGKYIVSVNETTITDNVVQVYDPDGVLDGRTVVKLGVGQSHLTADFGYKGALPMTGFELWHFGAAAILFLLAGWGLIGASKLGEVIASAGGTSWSYRRRRKKGYYPTTAHDAGLPS